MVDQLTLICPLSIPVPATQTAGLGLREMAAEDLDELAGLYFRACDPGQACDTLQEATDDVAASFNGDYGEFWWAASRVAAKEGQIDAAVMTVEQAPWDDVPPGPFIIELFTDRVFRRRGYATTLVSGVLEKAAAVGSDSVGLRVMSDNVQAIRLYEKLGFQKFAQ